MSKLPPPLTDPPCPDPDSRTTAALIAWAMAYGQQCYQQALEDAQRKLSGLGYYTCSDAIRALGEKR